MRIISQDGAIDIPCELLALSIGYEGENHKFNIYVRSELLDERPCVFARYSSESKAKKAMEMFRKEHLAYIGCNYQMDYMQNAPYQMGLPNPIYMNVGFVPPKVFQFPADDEIEVEDED